MIWACRNREISRNRMSSSRHYSYHIICKIEIIDAMRPARKMAENRQWIEETQWKYVLIASPAISCYIVAALDYLIKPWSILMRHDEMKKVRYMKDIVSSIKRLTYHHNYREHAFWDFEGTERQAALHVILMLAHWLSNSHQFDLADLHVYAEK